MHTAHVVDAVGYGLLFIMSLEPLTWWITYSRRPRHPRMVMPVLLMQFGISAACLTAFAISMVLATTDPSYTTREINSWFRRALGAALFVSLAGHWMWRYRTVTGGDE